MNALDDIESTLIDVAARFGPAVVGVGRGWGTGSGLVTAPGHVLVSAHALRGQETVVTFGDGERREATVAGVDADLDLAVLTVDTGKVDALAWASDAEPRLGQAVVALANPGGRGLRVSCGFLSSVGRSFRGPRGRRVAGAIEHTAPLARGSSGSPLLDTSGRVLGVNAVRAEGGLILAARADRALRERVGALARGEVPPRVRLGVALAPPRAAREMRRAVGLPERDGMLVRAVQDGSPAAAAGVRRGDLIVALGERPTPGIDALHDALESARAGAELPLVVVRGTDELRLPLEVSAP